LPGQRASLKQERLQSKHRLQIKNRSKGEHGR
jgi:hypothetical protein